VTTRSNGKGIRCCQELATNDTPSSVSKAIVTVVFSTARLLRFGFRFQFSISLPAWRKREMTSARPTRIGVADRLAKTSHLEFFALSNPWDRLKKGALLPNTGATTLQSIASPPPMAGRCRVAGPSFVVPDASCAVDSS
jgi:hypothetical protein